MKPVGQPGAHRPSSPKSDAPEVIAAADQSNDPAVTQEGASAAMAAEQGQVLDLLYRVEPFFAGPEEGGIYRDGYSLDKTVVVPKGLAPKAQAALQQFAGSRSETLRGESRNERFEVVEDPLWDAGSLERLPIPHYS